MLVARTNVALGLLSAALLATALQSCRNSAIRVPERDPRAFRSLEESPLLLDIPEDEELAPAERRSEGLHIADDERLLVEFPGTPLRTALAYIATNAGVTILSDESIEGTVEARFDDATLDDVLQTLLRQYDLALLPGPGNVFFVERMDDPSIVTDFVQLVNVRAEDVAANLALLVQDGARVIVDADRNLVCVVGSHADVAAVRRYIDHVDTLKDQVLLEVHLYQVTYDDGFDFGSVVDWLSHANGDAIQLTSSFAQTGDFTATLTTDGDFSVALDAIRRYAGLELVSSPRVLAVTNTPATVDVVREIPYIETTSTTTGTTGGTGSVVQESVQFKEAGLKLTITPSIQEHGYLQVTIAQSIAEEVGRFNDIPIVDTRSLATQFLVHDKETIVLGGLVQERHDEERRGIPLLMHLPVLGQLFRSDSDAVSKQELLVFVTPRILSPRQAAALAPHFKSEYRERRSDLDSKVLAPDELGTLVEPDPKD
ncbi:MAG: hypothetical protein R3F34_00960 [Planctomycetota bacterium]